MTDVRIPTEEEVERAAALSPLIKGPMLSEFADLDELRFRESIEDFGDPRLDTPRAIERKQLLTRLDRSLDDARIAPAGDIAELGAGACWLAAALTRRPAVRRVVALEFSERRLTELAPVAVAAIGGDPTRIERVVADFYAPGLDAGAFDFVFMDAAFHHAEDPERIAGIAFELLQPGGSFVLFREPTKALLRRTRDHGVEDNHGAFEREYFAREYLAFLREAGFAARKHPTPAGFRTTRERIVGSRVARPLNGVAFAEYIYVGLKP